jgi:eukaryotic-like serine/threonine-protein kinase
MAESIVPDKALDYIAQLLDGVEAAHAKGVVHRDLKPENILHDRSRDVLLIADFGIARFQEEELYTAVETAHDAKLANFQYAAPEQRDRAAPVDQRADIFALGLILNEMFTGQVPHGTHYKTVESVVSELRHLDEVVAVMLHRSPDERPQSVAEIRELMESSRSNQIEREPTEEELLRFMASDTRQIYEMAEMTARARQQLREGVVREWKAAQRR